MKIAYCGNFSQRHCTEVHLASTLENLGHEVNRIQEPSGFDKDFIDSLVDRVAGHDLFLFTRTWGKCVNVDHLREMKDIGIPTASYHLDLYVGLSRQAGLEDDAFWATDFVFTPDGDPASQEFFENRGINHHYMRPGVFEPECYIAQPSQEFINDKCNDIIFVGGGAPAGEPEQYGHNEWPYRGELLKYLRDKYGSRYTKYGYPQETVRNELLNNIYSGSKVVVGDSLCLNFNHPYYWSDRAYETIGRGGFLIHPYIKGMDEEFIDGETIVFYEYNNWDQLREKIDYYLEHDEEREKIRLAGHDFVKNNATYNNRLEKMLNIIFDTPAEQLNTNTPPREETIKINLGAGSEPTPGWINTDWLEMPGIDRVFNLLEYPWPFESNSAHEIKAIDVLEHMPNFTADNKSGAIEFVKECWRILKPGGLLTIQVPHWQSPNCWIDLTHVRGFDKRSMDYFDDRTEIGKAYGYYVKTKFDVDAYISIMVNQTDPSHDGMPSNVTFKMVKR